MHKIKFDIAFQKKRNLITLHSFDTNTIIIRCIGFIYKKKNKNRLSLQYQSQGQSFNGKRSFKFGC